MVRRAGSAGPGADPESGSLRLLDVVPSGGLGRVRIARLDGLDDRAMLGMRLVRTPGHFVGGAREQGQRDVQLGQCIGQEAIVGSFPYRRMQLTIYPRLRFRISGLGAEGGEEIFHRSYLGIGGMLGGEPCGGAFEDLPHGIQLDDFGWRKPSDGKAARSTFEQAARLKAANGIARGRSADAVFFSDVPVAYALSGPVLSLQKACNQTVVNFFNARRRNRISLAGECIGSSGHAVPWLPRSVGRYSAI
jgi:hypothetical protein